MSDAEEPTIADLIARARAAGPNSELEEILARTWRCPHCKHETTIQRVTFNGDDMTCPKCLSVGIEPVEGNLQ